MTIAAKTGRIAAQPCKTCGRTVEHVEMVAVAPRSAPWWSAVRHTAACGLPCVGGGVDAKAMRAGQVHGSERRPCPRCAVSRA